MGVLALNRAVFLDRDGVLNASQVVGGVPRPPVRLADFHLLPGVGEACRRLREAGFLLVVVTNQPDVARGLQGRGCVEQMNDTLRALLPLHDVLTCYHDDADGCECRKPRPGMILKASTVWGIDPAASFMVGDRWSDVEAGRAAGCGTFLIARPYSRPERCRAGRHVNDLNEAVDSILKGRGDEARQ